MLLIYFFVFEKKKENTDSFGKHPPWDKKRILKYRGTESMKKILRKRPAKGKRRGTNDEREKAKTTDKKTPKKTKKKRTSTKNHRSCSLETDNIFLRRADRKTKAKHSKAKKRGWKKKEPFSFSLFSGSLKRNENFGLLFGKKKQQNQTIGTVSR